MFQRNSMITAAVLTAFVLVVTGGVTARAAQALAAPNPTPTAAAGTTDPLADPSVQQVILQREAGYRKLIDEANARLLAYQQQLQAGQSQPQAAGSSFAAGGASDSSAYPVSPSLAAAIALNAAPGASLTGWPELVNYQGRAAYEVKLNQGLVYVDAANGKVLYNGAIARTAQGGTRESEEHEGGEGEGD